MRYLLISMMLLIGPLSALNAFAANWKGQTIGSVIQHYGDPSVVNHLRNGNTVYTFFTQHPKTFNLPQSSLAAVIALPRGGAIGVPAPAYTSPRAPGIRCTMTFVANKQGRVIQQRADRKGCDF